MQFLESNKWRTFVESQGVARERDLVARFLETPASK
jgi:hypothetical protein